MRQKDLFPEEGKKNIKKQKMSDEDYMTKSEEESYMEKR